MTDQQDGNLHTGEGRSCDQSPHRGAQSTVNEGRVFRGYVENAHASTSEVCVAARPDLESFYLNVAEGDSAGMSLQADKSGGNIRSWQSTIGVCAV
jgi:hypothetical protein